MKSWFIKDPYDAYLKIDQSGVLFDADNDLINPPEIEIVYVDSGVLVTLQPRIDMTKSSGETGQYYFTVDFDSYTTPTTPVDRKLIIRYYPTINGTEYTVSEELMVSAHDVRHMFTKQEFVDKTTTPKFRVYEEDGTTIHREFSITNATATDIRTVI